jgi:hypothetical protein
MTETNMTIERATANSRFTIERFSSPFDNFEE